MENASYVCPVTRSNEITKEDCMSVGSIFSYNRMCHEHECCYIGRICPACVLQGDVSKVEYRGMIFSIGKVNGEDCPYCEFHQRYGMEAKRTDKKLVEISTNQTYINVGDKRYRVVQMPLVSDFVFETHARIRNIVNSGLREKGSEIGVRSLIGKLEKRLQEKRERFGTKIVFVHNISLAKPKTKDAELYDALEDDEKEVVIAAKPRKPRKSKQPKTTASFPHLEDLTHGVMTDSILVPKWHPQKYFSENDLSEYVDAIVNGYKVTVNVTAGNQVTLLDEIGYLHAIRAMNLKYPPLEIEKIEKDSAQMLYFLIRFDLAEWEMFLLLENLLQHVPARKIAGLIQWKEKDLIKFMIAGKKIKKDQGRDSFRRIVTDRIPLEEALKMSGH